MRYGFKVAVGIATLMSVGTVATIEPAEARKRWRPIAECLDTIEGEASSTGILGMGTARSRIAAQSDWETRAANTYGPAYANLDNAVNVQWDCKRNAMVLAKCVVTARPCSRRISG